MSDYELLDQLVRVLDQLNIYSTDDRTELFDIAKDHLNDDERALIIKHVTL
jgi:hypothetical protein